MATNMISTTTGCGQEAGSRRRSSGALRTTILVLLVACSGAGQSALATTEEQTLFRRVPTQFIAALGEPDAVSGNSAQDWGLWRVDPGPRGVWLRNYEKLKANNGLASANWQFDDTDWWLEENGLIMEKPDFPLPPGKYVVTGDRETVAVLTIHPADPSGDRRWELNDGASLYDVTHLPCRSARYTPADGENACSPANAPKSAFRVAPGAAMPVVEGCNKQDYAVLFVIGIAVEN